MLHTISYLTQHETLLFKRLSKPSKTPNSTSQPQWPPTASLTTTLASTDASLSSLRVHTNGSVVIVARDGLTFTQTFCVLHARFSDVGAAPMARSRNRTKNDVSSL
ncbi:hypothetical protein KAF25_007985 [Fusarium avenaceum]|uniref:Uncharacterized protein n=1 Tax=Fusarium avenaceum TaxID=40199 RepID=A0A9P7H808_9HYPO|nr:hypothetical protein KAF25_007985 [Fusarium avenaceum]